jgi:hypothetical protein
MNKKFISKKIKIVSNIDIYSLSKILEEAFLETNIALNSD